mmetsp:Transcript_11704/g.21416  ORF Transcript_11704/g.21416 Transcript_11704/m.21416 type:complete len:96 (-) Transcript_11704:168-455(-)
MPKAAKANAAVAVAVARTQQMCVAVVSGCFVVGIWCGLLVHPLEGGIRVLTGVMMMMVIMMMMIHGCCLVTHEIEGMNNTTRLVQLTNYPAAGAA